MENDKEEVEVEVTEIGLTEDEIDEWIDRLNDLKETRDPATFELDDETELVVNFDEDLDEEDE